jgi:hypothetical protein
LSLPSFFVPEGNGVILGEPSDGFRRVDARKDPVKVIDVGGGQKANDLVGFALVDLDTVLVLGDRVGDESRKRNDRDKQQQKYENLFHRENPFKKCLPLFTFPALLFVFLILAGRLPL